MIAYVEGAKQRRTSRPIIAYVSVEGAFAVAEFLDRQIANNAPLPQLELWEEVRDALYAICNDTDQIRTK